MMYTHLRMLKVFFNGYLKFHEIPAFRGAIAKKVGYNHALFHNHSSDNNYHYRYPLIQYKSINKQPAILCIGEGLNEIHQFFAFQEWNLQIGNDTRNMKIKSLGINEYKLTVHHNYRRYMIFSWLALNQKNYRIYKETNSLAEQLALLERILRGNLLAFAKGVGWHIPKDVEVYIQRLINVHPVTIKGQKRPAFTLDFSTNLFLPNYIGLGKHASMGFGMIDRIPDNPKTAQKKTGNQANNN